MTECDLIAAYRKDNADLKFKLKQADSMIDTLIVIGEVMLLQDGMFDEDVRMAEDAWRAVVKRWRDGSAGEGNWSEETK